MIGEIIMSGLGLIVYPFKEPVLGFIDFFPIFFFVFLVGSNIGEGDGTPLQYSCLENPMDGGAW